MKQYRIYVPDLTNAQQVFLDEGIDSTIQSTYLATSYEADKKSSILRC